MTSSSLVRKPECITPLADWCGLGWNSSRGQAENSIESFCPNDEYLRHQAIGKCQWSELQSRVTLPKNMVIRDCLIVRLVGVDPFLGPNEATLWRAGVG